MSERQWLRAGLALLAVAATISACGSGASAGTGTSGGSSGASPNGSGGKSTLAHAQKGVKFAACMRSHGVSNFPDPDASGKLTIDAVANGSSVDTSAPAFTQALSACKSLEPAGFTGGMRSKAQQSGALRFARCMRDNGVTDFPDPVNGQPLIDTNHIPSTNSPGGMSALQAAMHTCSSLAAAAGVSR